MGTIRKEIYNEKVLSWYYLEPYTCRKSFYKKAIVFETEKYWYLQSYETLMCRYAKGVGTLERLSGAKSNTTSCHLSAFYSDFRLGDYSGKKFYSLDRIDPVDHEEEKRKADEWFDNFKKDYDDLNPIIKEKLAESDIILTSQEQADDLMRMSKIFSLMMDMTSK